MGTIKLSKYKNHNFTIPNDPTNGVWNNYCLEDMARYWDLPNVLDAKHCYFQVVNASGNKKSFAPTIRDAIVEDSKEQNFKMDKNYRGLSMTTGGMSALFGYLFYLAA